MLTVGSLRLASPARTANRIHTQLRGRSAAQLLAARTDSPAQTRGIRSSTPVQMGGLPDQLRQAYKGARKEIGALPRAHQKLARFFRILRIVAMELVATATLAPFGYRAMKYHRELTKQGRVRTVQYGDKERNRFDIYLPQRKSDADEAAPVVLFVHGGVWVSGDKWNYAPMARRLSDEGALVYIMEYTLFPDARSDEMAAEVDAAISWAMTNSGRYGGDPSKVHLMGHSAGTQITSMALWVRARRLLQGAPPDDPSHRQVRAFLGLSGVYNVYDHYQYEFNRGVAEMSCMKPAIGGVPAFKAQSIQMLVADAVAAGGPALEALPSVLPATVLLHSQQDGTVPWSNSARFCLTLQEAGVPATMLLYPGGGHGEFVTDWWPEHDPPRSASRREAPMVAGPGEFPHLAPELADICRLVTDPAAVAEAARVGSSADLRVEPIMEPIGWKGWAPWG